MIGRLHTIRPRIQFAIAAAGFAAVAVAYLLLNFLRPQNYLLSGWDFLSHQFFLKTFLGESLRAGEWPLWNPYICAGRPFAADPQSGVFYPPNWLYAVLPVETTVTLLVSLHIAAAGLFAYVLGRTLGLSRIAAAIAGVAFMFNAFLVTHAYRGQSERVCAIAYMPLMLALAERAASTRRPATFLWLGVAGALQLVAGAPDMMWMTWVSVGLYLVVRPVLRWRRDGVRGAGIALGGGALAVAACAGLSAVQLLPTLELIGLSNRAEPSLEFASAFPFKVDDVVHQLFPTFEAPPAYTSANPEVLGYVGILPLVLAAVGVLQGRGRIRWAIVAVGLLHVFVMIGRATPVFDLLYHVLPGMRSFRLPSRSIVMVALCVAMLAGFGAESLMRGERRMRAVVVAVASAVSLAAFMWIVSAWLLPFGPPGAGRGSALWVPLGFAFASILLVALASLPRPTWAGAVWLVVVTGDLFFVGGTMSRYRELEAAMYKPPVVEGEVVDGLRKSPGHFRFALPNVLVRENVGMIVGQSGVNGFISLSLDRYYKFVHAMSWQPVPDKFTHTPDDRVFQTDNPFPFKVLNVRFGTGLEPGGKEPRVLPRTEYGPRAFFVPKHVVISDDDETIERMRSPAFDPLDTVILGESPPDGFAGGGADAPESKVEITSYAPMRITLRARAPSDGFLVLSELEYPGWEATVDGEPAPILRADYLLRAIPLRAGTYERIEFRYAPGSFTVGWIVTFASGIVVLAALALLRRRRPPIAVSEHADPDSPGRAWTPWAQSVVMLAASLLAFPLMRASNAEEYAIVGGGLAQADQRKDAIEWLQRALELAPTRADAWMNLGTVLGQSGRRDEAIEKIEQSLRLDPNSVRAVSNLAALQFQKGEVETAKSLLQKAIGMDPAYSEAQFNMGRVLVLQSRPDEAAPFLERAVELVPGNARSYQRVARVWTDAREYERAIAVLRLGMSRLPRSADLADELASLLAACPAVYLRDGEEAVRLSEFANALTGSKDAFKLRTLAAAYAQAGDDSRAIEAARAALQQARRIGETALVDEITAALTELGVPPTP